MKKFKNKGVVILATMIVLILLILGILYIKNKSNMLGNVRIISDHPSAGIPSKIICNDKEYLISNESDIYSIKYYNGKLYYYKDIGGLSSYNQAALEISDLNSIYYEFGEIILNETTGTYTIKAIAEVSHLEYENGNKEEIKYCVGNTDGEYKLEIQILD